MQVFSLLFHHIQPPNILPSTFSCGNPKFNISWLEQYPWLRFSPKLDAIFCGPCSLLLNSAERKDKGMLVNRPYSNWVIISNALSSHASVHYHHDCLGIADSIKITVDNPRSRIDAMFDKHKAMKISTLCVKLCVQ